MFVPCVMIKFAANASSSTTWTAWEISSVKIASFLVSATNVTRSIAKVNESKSAMSVRRLFVRSVPK